VGGKLVKEMMAHGNGIMGYVVLIIRVMGQEKNCLSSNLGPPFIYIIA
jgi:hypothetical protein